MSKIHKRIGTTAALAAAAFALVGTPQPVAAPVSASGITQQGQVQRTDQTAPPAQAVRAPSADRAILPLLPYMERSARREPIWTGGLRDSGHRARPVSRRGFRS